MVMTLCGSPFESIKEKNAELIKSVSALAMSDYTRSTFPDFIALAETHTRFGLPSTRMRTF